MTVERPALRRLADALGILPEHVDVRGRVVVAREESVVLLAASLGHAASTEEEAARSLGALASEAGPAPPGGALPPGPGCGCVSVTEALSGRRGFGITANLWSLRSARSFGIGDFTDLAALAEWAGSEGAAFVGVSPLAATRGEAAGACPYSPVTREFLSPLHADVAAVPEMETSREARRLLDEGGGEERRRRLNAEARLDAAAVLAEKLELLRALHADFALAHEGRDTERGRAHARFVTEGGERLRDFATWCALEEHARRPEGGAALPRELAHARAPGVDEARRHLAEDVAFHAWLQFELDRQLARAAERARGAGLRLGLFLDLPLGSARGGFDAWAEPDAFVAGASLGAPPDPLGTEGQDWDLPPPHPLVARRAGEAHWRRVLRASFRHAGMLRVDHALGLARQFWVPRGLGPAAGAYVRQDLGALLRVLAEESRRAGAVVVGEDLGTAAPGIRETLDAWGVLGTRVLPFERDSSGAFLPAAAWSGSALAAAGTHDLVPLAGWWSGTDLELRHGLGLIRGRALETARAARRDERARLVERLRAEGVLAEDGAPHSAGEVVAAVHAFLAWTKAPLVAVQLDDLCCETEPANLPGVPQDVHASWTRRMALAVEDLPRSPDVRRGLAGLAPRRLPQA